MFKKILYSIWVVWSVKYSVFEFVCFFREFEKIRDFFGGYFYFCVGKGRGWGGVEGLEVAWVFIFVFGVVVYEVIFRFGMVCFNSNIKVFK